MFRLYRAICCGLTGATTPLVIRDSEVVATDLRVPGDTAVVVEDSNR